MARSISEATRDQFLHVLELSPRRKCLGEVQRSERLPRRVHRIPLLVRMQQGRGPLPLLPPDADALRRIIEEPARAAGLRFEERDGKSLADRIRTDAAAHAELLPLLEYVLRELFEQRKDGKLLWDVYEQLGGVEGALAKQAEATFEALPRDARESLARVLKWSRPSGNQPVRRAWNRVIRQQAPLDRSRRPPPLRKLVDALRRPRASSPRARPMRPDRHGRARGSPARLAAGVGLGGHNRDFLRVRARIAARLQEGSPLLEGDPLLDAAKAHLALDREAFTAQQREFIEASIRGAEAPAATA